MRLVMLLLLPVLLAACVRPTSLPKVTSSTLPKPTPTSAVSGGAVEFEIAATAPAPAVPTAAPTAQGGSSGEPAFVSAHDPRIRYIGRADMSAPDQVLFDWPAVSIAARFTGTSLTLHLRDERNQYDVVVDGKMQLLRPVDGQERYVVAENLQPGRHTVLIRKRTEAYVGSGAFLGFTIDPDARLLSAPPAADRRLAFIGDSITAGYGNEGDGPTCYFTPDTQNVDLSYAGQTARELDAEYTTLAVSGLGAVRNIRETTTVSQNAALSYLWRTLAMQPGRTWDGGGQAEPDAVVVNLGTNDFSTTPFPGELEFVAGYVQLLQGVRELYPAAHIFAVAGPLMMGPANRYIEQAAAQARVLLDDERIHYVLIEDDLERTEADFGCDWHPNVAGHRKIAAQLIPALRTVLDW